MSQRIRRWVLVNAARSAFLRPRPEPSSWSYMAGFCTVASVRGSVPAETRFSLSFQRSVQRVRMPSNRWSWKPCVVMAKRSDTRAV